MSLSDFATFSTAISGMAVTASLIYLALQTHQNAKHTKALIEQGRTARMTDIFLRMCDTEFATALIRGQDGTPDAETIEKYQYMIYCTLMVSGLEDTFCQHKEGLISEDRFRSHRQSAVALMRQAGFRHYWQAWKAARPNTLEDFKAWVDAIGSTTKTTPINVVIDALWPTLAKPAEHA